jgi:hypothetical protein
MRTRVLAALSAVLLATALAPAPAGAIINGEPDGDVHSNVGALLVDLPAGWVIGCSGTLIDSTVFLTAGHCVVFADFYYPDNQGFAVSFESDLNIDDEGFVHPDSIIAVESLDFMPSFAFASNGTRDVGVAVLETEAPAEIVPAELPGPGAAAAAVGQEAVSVGYGWNSLDRSPSSPTATYTSSGERTVGTSWVGSVSPNWLTARGAQSACYHDSGGPQFVDDVLVSITVTGDVPCVTLQRNQRLDLRDVQEWLSQVMQEEMGCLPDALTLRSCPGPGRGATACERYRRRRRRL